VEFKRTDFHNPLEIGNAQSPVRPKSASRSATPVLRAASAFSPLEVEPVPATARLW
jgi:hypothetical protein